MSAHRTRLGAPLRCADCGSHNLEAAEHQTTVSQPYSRIWSWWCSCGVVAQNWVTVDGEPRPRYGSKAEAAAAAAAHEAEYAEAVA